MNEGMGYDEMARVLNEQANKNAALCNAMVPHLVDILGLEEPYELGFTETALTRHSVTKEAYTLRMNITVKREPKG